jgi:hypothetical protein
MLGVCAVLDVLLAGRSSILGLAGFVTLPSREIVAIWQFAGIMVGSGELLRAVCQWLSGAHFNRLLLHL